MVAYNKFEQFVLDLANGKHDFSAHAIEIFLVANANPPSATADLIKSDLTEITQENGYTAPEDVTPSGAEVTGTDTLSATDVTITASGGTIGPFQFVVLFNQGQTTPVDPLIAWWDRGAYLTLQDGESFTVDFQKDQIFTLV